MSYIDFLRTGLVDDDSLIKCGSVFSHGVICQHVTDCTVLDDYIDNLQYCQKVTLVSDYTEQLFQNLEEAIE
jgi:hypothetical protein